MKSFNGCTVMVGATLSLVALLVIWDLEAINSRERASKEFMSSDINKILKRSDISVISVDKDVTDIGENCVSFEFSNGLMHYGMVRRTVSNVAWGEYKEYRSIKECRMAYTVR